MYTPHCHTQVTYQTELGQLMDLLTAPEDNVDLDRFNMTRYRLIVEYKSMSGE